MNRIKKTWKCITEWIHVIGVCFFLGALALIVWQFIYTIEDIVQKRRVLENSFKYEVNIESTPRYYTDSYVCTNNSISFYDGINSNNITSTRKWTVKQQHQ